ncbi:cation-transporting P-type ATPase [Syntrophus aciditrophicus]|uniref:Calcium-transporting ATPase n=1 Tax=Syntrophus aciditrophicus (strain SB) TaxID=56780 RepID=Q2LX78_SYNAS|nr:cation-transporting P-type ATPase [Syntrophus aciditrophicus]ABC78687.1 calcium-transporting ATPase [Syntrophus aciditrophicus SB]OPY16367.1 MAG: putative cation-transporting ATPase F [Syntrophus sp. PtaB.Bin075]
MDNLIGRHWHYLPAEEVIDLLDGNKDQGLDLFEVDHRREQFGYNVLTTKKGKGPLLRFLLQFHQPLVYILLAATVITLLLQEWVDAGVIFGVVLVNSIIGFLQESKAVKAMEALARTMVTEATVLRSGEKRRISSAEVAPGDIVLLQSGDKVPADMRLISVRDLHVDESALTGESVAVEKCDKILPHDTILADRRNMVYGSSLVTYGQAVGIVVAIGDATEVGRISELLATTEELETPLLRKIARFSKVLLYVILALAAVTFGVGVFRGQSALDMFMAAVALAVSAIPEGLPAAMTITLAIGVARMARKQAIIRKLPAVETLGSTTVICSDKTGTLTENQMTVQEIMAGSALFKVTGGGYEPAGKILTSAGEVPGDFPVALTECLRCGLLCNDSLVVEKEERWTVQGDPTEGALLAAAAKGGLSDREINEKWPRLDSIPFESEHQYMATLHAAPEGGHVVYAKGSVEAMLERCRRVLSSDGEPANLDTGAILDAVEAMAARGLRVLAFARMELPEEKQKIFHEDVAEGMIFLGLQGMIDPPRAEAVEAVRNCHSAGIRVKMITGDHALTASAIAGQIGLAHAEKVVTGRELADMSDTELLETVEDVSVYARVAPEQKLRLVEALQANGHIVAMTGDGVNDAPALKRADIGVAMGITGTDVAKEAADMVLTDDNFASIEAAVEEGRGTFDNLTKFIVWTLPTNIGEGLVILAAVFLGTLLPILAVQILWINMTTAVLLGLMLVFEPKEWDIMDRPPRLPAEPILTPMLIRRMLMVGGLMVLGAFGLFKWELASGAEITEARTVAVNLFVMVELFYLFNCRSLTKSVFKIGFFSNPWIFGGCAVMVVLQILFTYVPVMNTAFQSAPIGIGSWIRILAVSILVMLIVGVEKRYTNRN